MPTIMPAIMLRNQFGGAKSPARRASIQAIMMFPQKSADSTPRAGLRLLDFPPDAVYNRAHLGAFLDSTGMTRLQVHVEDERTS